LIVQVLLDFLLVQVLFYLDGLEKVMATLVETGDGMFSR